MRVKILLVSAIVAAVVVGACLGAYKQGFKEGIQAYHNQCFYISGFLIDDEGHVVSCVPLSIVPKQEMKGLNASAVY